MSTTNTEELILFSTKKIYNGSRYKYYQTNRSYDAFLENDAEYRYPERNSKTVYYKSITEPISISESINNADAYNYGILTNSNKKYYIFVDSITTDQFGVSTLRYSIDWWATEWANVHPTKAHVTRKSDKPSYMKQPFVPLNVSSEETMLTDKFCIMATYIPSVSEAETSYISTLILEGNYEILKMVEEGYWTNIIGIAGGDVKDCFVVPLYSYDDFLSEITTPLIFTINDDSLPSPIGGDLETWIRVLRDLTEKYPAGTGDYPITIYNEGTDKWLRIIVDTELPYGYRIIDIDDPTVNKSFVQKCGSTKLNSDGELVQYNYIQTVFTSNAVNFWSKRKQINETFESNDVKVEGIMDWNGDNIWLCPYGVTINGFDISLLVGLSHVMLQFTPKVVNPAKLKLSDKLTGVAFSYDCKHPGLFIDEYREYVLRNREYDIEMRSIQSERQELQAWSSVAENIGFGAAFGQKAGAVAAGIGGTIEAVSTYLINSYFDPQIQNQYNKRYARVTDQISLVGDSITNLYNVDSTLTKYALIMDTPSQNVMYKDIEVNGYVCDEIVSDLEDMFSVGARIQADNVTIEGASCLDAKHQTVYRLQNGVEFI